MAPGTHNTSLTYVDSDGVPRVIGGCKMYVRNDRFWMWSDTLQHNLAYRVKSREDCLLRAIDSLLFTVRLRDERIAELQRIADLAEQFADQIKPDGPED